MIITYYLEVYVNNFPSLRDLMYGIFMILEGRAPHKAFCHGLIWRMCNNIDADRDQGSAYIKV